METYGLRGAFLTSCWAVSVSNIYIYIYIVKTGAQTFMPSLSVSSKTYDPPQMGAQKTLALPLNLPALPGPNN